MLTDLDQTTLLPRQRAAIGPDPAVGVDRWQRSATGEIPSHPDATEAQDRALATLAWLIPTIVTAGASLVRLPWPGLSNSELDVWGFVSAPWGQGASVIPQMDPSVVPYAIVMHAWSTVLGTSEFALRLPSVLAMAAAAGMLSTLCRRLISARSGLIAGLLFALTPAVSRFGQNVGPEAIMTAAAILATLALVWAFDHRTGETELLTAFAHYAAYAVATAVIGLVDVTAMILVLCAHAATVIFMRPRILPPWLAGAAIGAVPGLWLAYVAATAWTGHASTADTSAPTIDHAVGTLFGSLLVGGIVIGLGLLSISARRPAIVFTIGAAGTLAAILIADNFVPIATVPAVLVTLGAWIGVAAMQLARFPLARGLVAVVAVGLLGLPAQISVREAGGHDQATRSLASILTAHDEAGDVIVYGPTDAQAQTARELVARYVPVARRPKDILAVGAPFTGGHLYASECAAVAKCLGTSARVWVIRVDGDTNPLDGLSAGKDGALRVDYTSFEEWTFPGLTLTLFVRNSPTSGN